RLLEDFCKTHKKAKLKLKGIGHFGNQVIFVEVEPSKEMNLLYKELVNELNGLKWISWHEYEKKNIHFHSTLAEKDIENKFEEIFSYSKKENLRFELNLDNICILTKPKDKWILHKEFLLKN
ncbi:MAG: 2'-5' RNA ligase family protein, partial [Candidatus Pacearchaeota archaeon]|nr:2'-5' RNA ligase family protein [Candidatus Pacearchaeota archaeon]